MFLRETNGEFAIFSEKSEVLSNQVALNQGNPATALPESNQLAGEKYPATRTIWLSDSDVRSMTYAEVRYAINEMFARHGATFKNPDIQSTFGKFPWYQPNSGLSFDEIESLHFSAMENANVKVLGNHRDRMKP